MALQDGTNPIVFDATTQAVARKLKIGCLVWSGITTGGHDLLINTASGGSIVFEGRSIQNGTTVVPINGWVDGLYITTLDSGKVMAYLAE